MSITAHVFTFQVIDTMAMHLPPEKFITPLVSICQLFTLSDFIKTVKIMCCHMPKYEERGGSVVECLSREGGVAALNTALCP